MLNTVASIVFTIFDSTYGTRDRCLPTRPSPVGCTDLVTLHSAAQWGHIWLRDKTNKRERETWYTPYHGIILTLCGPSNLRVMLTQGGFIKSWVQLSWHKPRTALENKVWGGSKTAEYLPSQSEILSRSFFIYSTWVCSERVRQKKVTWWSVKCDGLYIVRLSSCVTCVTHGVSVVQTCVQFTTVAFIASKLWTK